LKTEIARDSLFFIVILILFMDATVTSEELEAGARSSDIRFRLLGFLPLAFFLGQVLHYWRINELGNVLWMCNIGNLLLAIGLFLNQAKLIRVAAIWMVPGLAVWFVYVVLEWGIFLTSTLAHLGGIIVSGIALRRVRMDQTAWLYALAWYFTIQLLSRLITPAALNVNVAHAVDSAWKQTFTSYWKFWAVLSVITVALMWIVNVVLYKIWPPRAPVRPQS
jgi:hypothetical protein